MAMDVMLGLVGLIAFLTLATVAGIQFRFNRLELNGMARLLRNEGLVHNPVPTISRLPLQAAEFGDAGPWRNVRRWSKVAAGIGAIVAVGGLVTLTVATVAENYEAMPGALLMLCIGFIALAVVGVVTVVAEGRARAHLWRSILDAYAPNVSTTIRWHKMYGWQNDLAAAALASHAHPVRSGPILSKRRKRKLAARRAREASQSPDQAPRPPE
ncbi:hypothetical protein G7068_15555 [Leucobacter viscericola]|uniref:Uncharacterized protein n=1 Tax=Leucobacter viscericola TaxID=2714935 RepID=A0A6G7XJB7_9MICO|nr:hypothetical protein [Leucobacter viscericola]QIK64467.1 hypothetical protein G7068_15555 [Leucobacter viscericola]